MLCALALKVALAFSQGFCLQYSIHCRVYSRGIAPLLPPLLSHKWRYQQEMLSLFFLYLSPGPLYSLLLRGRGQAERGGSIIFVLLESLFPVLLEEMELRKGTMPRKQSEELARIESFLGCTQCDKHCHAVLHLIYS